MPCATSFGSLTSIMVISPEGEEVSGLSSEYFTMPLDCHVVSLLKRGIDEVKQRGDEVSTGVTVREKEVIEAVAIRGREEERVRGSVRAATRGRVRADMMNYLLTRAEAMASVRDGDGSRAR